MSTCFTEGDLRASLDGELDAPSSARLSVHLAECASCEALRQQLAGRASRVAGMMSALETPPAFERPRAAVLPMPRIAPRPSAQRIMRSAGVLGAIAAGLAIAALMLPPRPQPKIPVGQDAGAAQPNPVALQAPPVFPVLPMSLPTHPRHRLLGRPDSRAGVLTNVSAPAAVQADADRSYFLALDDEPIETGIVMRVASPSGDFQADVIVGPDGRAHAIRIVTDGY
jgi:anti-sigma factor RsiW